MRKKGMNSTGGEQMVRFDGIYADINRQRKAQLRGRRGAEKKGGTKLKFELLPNYCKSSCSARSCPGNLSHCSLSLHICPHSSFPLMMI